jgi:plasmid stability protein
LNITAYATMRFTFQFDDDLHQRLRIAAKQEGTSLSHLINRLLRQQLCKPRKRMRYVQKTYDLCLPRIDLTKALSLAAELEDERIIEKMSRNT